MYKYEKERHAVFTVEGIKMIMKLKEKMPEKGTLIYLEDLIAGLTGDSWQMVACIDFLKEQGELKEIEYNYPIGQKRIFEIL